MTISRATLPLLVLCCVVGLSLNGYAQSVGEQALAVTTTSLRIGSRVVGRVAADDRLLVLKQMGEWLWVESPSGNRGWVLQQEVKFVPPPQAPGGDPYLTGWVVASHVRMMHDYVELLADNSLSRPDSHLPQLNLLSEHCQQFVKELKQADERATTTGGTAAFTPLIKVAEAVEAECLALSQYCESPSRELFTKFERARTEVQDRFVELRDANQLEEQ